MSMGNMIKREFVVDLQKRLQEELNFIQVVLGPRQVGKTTGLEQITKAWNKPFLMVSADEVSVPDQSWIDFQWKRARELKGEALLVIDEIQKINDWSAAVKYLFDQDRKQKRLKVVLLGSASLSLQKGLSESLAGRYEVIVAHHWSLNECKEAFGWGLEEFLKFGGYPAASELIHDVPRWKKYIRDSIIEPVLIKDILGVTAVNKPALFRQTFDLIMNYPAQEVSLQKLLGQLQDRGNAHTIKHYLELFEGAFLIKTLQKYSGSEVKKRASSPKIFPLNMALIHAFKSPNEAMLDPDWYGRIVETAVGIRLSLLEGKLFYWRVGKLEVDFILEDGKKLYAIEVKSNRREKNHKGLLAFKKRYPQSRVILMNKEKAQHFLSAKGADSAILDNYL